MHGVVNFFGRISFLVEQNTQASYFFMTAMLQVCCRTIFLVTFVSNKLPIFILKLPQSSWYQLFDRSGMLYGELARFVLRLLGVKRKPKKGSLQGPEAPAFEGPSQQFMEAPKAGNNWDNVWGN